jgi:hypothetical protein
MHPPAERDAGIRPRRPKMNYLTTPAHNVYSIGRIGGAKATANHFVILGQGTNEALEIHACPGAVAVAWRDALTEILLAPRPSRGGGDQIDWAELAFAVDPKWAEKHYGSAAE